MLFSCSRMFHPDIALADRLLTTKQVMDLLGISRTTLWRLRKDEGLPSLKVGGTYRFDKNEVLKWVRESPGLYTVLPEEDIDPGKASLRPDEQLTVSFLESKDWSFADMDTGYLTHDFHPYPARFPPQIPATLIEALTREGEVILDPFVGCGTTLVEAFRLGRKSIGLDVNPIAVLVSKAKTCILSDDELEEVEAVSQALEGDLALASGHLSLFGQMYPQTASNISSVPNIPNMDKWFAPHVQSELASCLGRIAQVRSERARTLIQAALSSIIIRVSYQDSETRYVARNKDILAGTVYRLLLVQIANMQRKLEMLKQYAGNPEPEVFVGDCRCLREIPNNSVDLIVTSPPYPNAYDYHLYHRHRLYWLGFDPKQVLANEIGSHLKYQYESGGIENFQTDMADCFDEISRVLRRKRFLAIVVGDSIFKGNLVRNDQILSKLASEVGLRLVSSIRRGIHPTRRSVMAVARRATTETVLLFRSDKR